jgi:hypothetical protein
MDHLHFPARVPFLLVAAALIMVGCGSSTPATSTAPALTPSPAAVSAPPATPSASLTLTPAPLASSATATNPCAIGDGQTLTADVALQVLQIEANLESPGWRALNKNAATACLTGTALTQFQAGVSSLASKGQYEIVSYKITKIIDVELYNGEWTVAYAATMPQGDTVYAKDGTVVKQVAQPGYSFDTGLADLVWVDGAWKITDWGN